MRVNLDQTYAYQENNMKKHFIGLCILLVTSMLLTSCGGGETKTDPGSKVETQTEAGTTAETTAPRQLPVKDMGGFTLHMAKIDQEKIAWSTVTFAAEELTGDMINDDIYNRNLRLTEGYNFKLKETSFTDMANQIAPLVEAGDDTYSLFYHSLNNVAPKAVNGYFTPLDTIDTLCLDEEWWDAGMRRDLSVTGHLYFCMGDLLLSMADCVQVVYYNKQLADDLKITNLYDLVRDGKWTADAMVSMMEKGHRDVNGDAVIDEKDCFGLLYGNTTRTTFYAGMQGRVCTLDSNGTPTVTAMSDISVRAFEAASKVFQLKDAAYSYHKFKSARPGIVEMFSDNRCLFYSNGISAAAQYMRDITVDYGFLPCPKLDENQSEYYSQVSYTVPVLMMPVTNKTAEDTAFVMEVLARDSGESVLSDYYDTCFSAKYTRDAESYEMLQIAVKNHIYDIGAVFDWGKLSSGITTLIESGGDTLASSVEKNKAAAETAIKTLLDTAAASAAKGGK